MPFWRVNAELDVVIRCWRSGAPFCRAAQRSSPSSVAVRAPQSRRDEHGITESKRHQAVCDWSARDAITADRSRVSEARSQRHVAERMPNVEYGRFDLTVETPSQRPGMSSTT
jgi:hypothetical protein